LLLAPCAAGASAISVRHRICEKDHLVAVTTIREMIKFGSFFVNCRKRLYRLYGEGSALPLAASSQFDRKRNVKVSVKNSK
jgi:hypothetical protein